MPTFEEIWKISVGYLLSSVLISAFIEALFEIDWKWGMLIWIIITIGDSIEKTYYIFRGIGWLLEELKVL